jgi:hypothetical protein
MPFRSRDQETVDANIADTAPRPYRKVAWNHLGELLDEPVEDEA